MSVAHLPAAFARPAIQPRQSDCDFAATGHDDGSCHRDGLLLELRDHLEQVCGFKVERRGLRLARTPAEILVFIGSTPVEDMELPREGEQFTLEPIIDGYVVEARVEFVGVEHGVAYFGLEGA